MKKFLTIVFIALILRLLLITFAHHGDLNNNISWGTIAYERGLNGFYDGYQVADSSSAYEGYSSIKNWPYSAPNQPPLTILLFAVSRFIWQHLRDFFWYMNWELQVFPSRLVWFWDEKGMDVMVKLPSVLADLGIGLLIYKYFEKKNNQKSGILLSAIWLFNPITWYNSAIWGQTDSIVNLFGLIAVLALMKRKVTRFAIFFTLSFLFKGSLGIFIPVLFFVCIYQQYSIKQWIKAAFSSILTIVLVSIWFHPSFDLLSWISKLYLIQILPGEIGFLTANSFNLWWLINSGKVLDSTLYFGIPARILGYVISLLGMVFVIFWLKSNIKAKLDGYRNDHAVFFALALTSLITFLFMTRIHERYLYPFFPYATFLIASIPGFWVLYIIISLIHVVNLFNFFWVPDLVLLKDLLLTTSLPKILSVINLLAIPSLIFLNSFNRPKKI